MSKVLVTESYLTDIGNAIRAKTKSTTKYKPSKMAKAIGSIVGGDPAVVVNSDSAWKYSITQKEHENIVVNVSGSTFGDNTSGYQTKLIFTPTISSSYGYNAGTIRKTVDEENHIANFTADDVTEVDGLLNDGWAGIYALASSPTSSSVARYFNNYNDPESSEVRTETSIENLLILGYYTVDSSGNLVAKTKNNSASYVPSTEASLKKYQNKYATDVSREAFYGFAALTSVDIPNATNIDNGAFQNCSALTSVDLLNATSLGRSAFNSCSALTSANLPNVINTSSFEFASCSNLTSVNLPSATSIGEKTFFYCTSLASINIPSATSIDKEAFYGCVALRNIDLPNVTSISGNAFYGCNMENIYLRSKTMCSCSGALGFKSATSLSIYVPESLIDSYKTATVWSAYANIFKTLESIKLTKISIIGSKKFNTYNGNKTGTYKVQYNDGVVSPEQAGVTWSITGNATISKDGVVTLKNASVGDKLTITATSTYNTSISASLTVSIVNVATSMTVDLNNGQWVDTGTTIDGHTVYKSDAGSYNTNNGASTCTVTVKGYSMVTVYLRSYAESSYDYAEVGPLDGEVIRDDQINVLSTKGKQSNTTYLSHTFIINNTNAHTFQVLYSKDSSGNNDDDRGYFYVVCE